MVPGEVDDMVVCGGRPTAKRGPFGIGLNVSTAKAVDAGQEGSAGENLKKTRNGYHTPEQPEKSSSS